MGLHRASDEGQFRKKKEIAHFFAFCIDIKYLGVWGLVTTYFGPQSTENLRIWKVFKNIKSKISKIEDFPKMIFSLL